METGQKIELFGFEELNKFFETLSRSDQRKIIMDSFRIGGKPLIELSKQLLKSNLKTKSRTRNLEKSMGFVAGKGSRKSVFVSAKIGARRFGSYRGYHGHLFDAGTTNRQTKRGFNRGTMPATRFFTNALQQSETQLTNDAAENILQALDKLIQRNLKKQTKI